MMLEDVEAASPEKQMERADVETKFSPPVPSIPYRLLIIVATLLTVLTYLEDALRCVTLWEDQLSFVARHSGLPRIVASAALLTIAFVQVLSTLLVVPPAAFPSMARPEMAICTVVALSVLVQPVIFNQLTNFELMQLSAAQLGSLGLIFGEAHRVAHPQPKPFAAFVKTPAEALEAREIVQWVRLGSRMMLTVDLTIVFGMRLLTDADALFMTAGKLDANNLFAAAIDLFPLVGGMLVWLGFKTEACASAVAIAAFIDAFRRFPFWIDSRNADYHRFHFFQAMTPVGGLLLLAAIGPGRFSVDHKAKRT